MNSDGQQEHGKNDITGGRNLCVSKTREAWHRLIRWKQMDEIDRAVSSRVYPSMFIGMVYHHHHWIAYIECLPVSAAIRFIQENHFNFILNDVNEHCHRLFVGNGRCLLDFVPHDGGPPPSLYHRPVGYVLFLVPCLLSSLFLIYLVVVLCRSTYVFYLLKKHAGMPAPRRQQQ